MSMNLSSQCLYVLQVRHNPAIPSVIYGACALGSAVILLFLPETKGKPLPQTIAEAEKMTGYDSIHIQHFK